MTLEECQDEKQGHSWIFNDFLIAKLLTKILIEAGALPQLNQNTAAGH
jgi:hypothetical protein